MDGFSIRPKWKEIERGNPSFDSFFICFIILDNYFPGLLFVGSWTRMTFTECFANNA